MTDVCQSGMQPGAVKRTWAIDVCLDADTTSEQEHERLLDQLAGAHMDPHILYDFDGYTHVAVTVRATTLASALSRAFQEIAKCNLPYAAVAAEGALES